MPTIVAELPAVSGAWRCRVDDHAYAFGRVRAESRAMVVFNHAAASTRLHVPLQGLRIEDGARLDHLLGAMPPVEARRGTLDIALPPRSASIYR